MSYLTLKVMSLGKSITLLFIINESFLKDMAQVGVEMGHSFETGDLY